MCYVRKVHLYDYQWYQVNDEFGDNQSQKLTCDKFEFAPKLDQPTYP